EGIQEACGGQPRGLSGIVTIVRTRLARQICTQFAGPGGVLPLITLSPEWETAFHEALSGPAEDRQLAMAPTKLSEFMRRFREVFDAHAAESPVLLTGAAIRG
ncbi:FHIPEP family type III secretion protein, partial [Stenotrophomonas sp. A3_2]|uniref:FHIPEP family type III secretion protein n=1 Tax=Stenotrophomonas sp. A3_2 TaxID=3119978 RepID=UPI002FC32B6C